MSGGRQPGGVDDAGHRASVPRFVRSGVRSTAEVRAYLRRQGLPAQRVEAKVRAYRALGLLDDRVAARLCAEHWARRGYAAAAIHVKLFQKGFSDARIRATLNRHDHPTEDESRARTWLAQRPRLGNASSPRARLARALASRGFDAELIERLLGESSESDRASQ